MRHERADHPCRGGPERVGSRHLAAGRRKSPARARPRRSGRGRRSQGAAADRRAGARQDRAREHPHGPDLGQRGAGACGERHGAAGARQAGRVGPGGPVAGAEEDRHGDALVQEREQRLDSRLDARGRESRHEVNCVSTAKDPTMSKACRQVILRAAGVITGLAVTLATPIGQSQNAFGVPSADQPQPGAAIKAVPGSRAQGWLSQGRSEVLARHGMVATSDPLAAEAGLEILRQGGNAIDAAVATGAVLDVTSQNDTGIGGDLFALVYVAKDKKLYALNSGGWAPTGWTPEFFAKLGGKGVPNSGVNSATVPGAISGYDALLKRFGSMGFKETFERAARLADEGWGLAERRHSDLKGATNGLRNDPDSKDTFLVDGQTPALYSIIRNPALARGLRLIQAQGRDAFYRGPIADAIVAKVQANGGVMTKADLEEFQSEWTEPISTNYHGYDVFELPPPGQGFAALEMLNILEVCVPKFGTSLAALGPADPQYWHY